MRKQAGKSSGARKGGAEPAVPSTARASKRPRVFHIAKLMVTREWSEEKCRELAEEWGFEVKTVADYASEASRLLDFHVKDRDELVRLGQVRLREIGEENGPDRVTAWRTLFENLGVLRQKHELSGPDGKPIEATVKLEPLEHMRALLRDPPPELEALLREEWGERTVVR